MGKQYRGLCMPIEKAPFLQNTSGSVIDNRHEAYMAAQQSIARGYDDLVNDRVRPWKQAKTEADRMRAIR